MTWTRCRPCVTGDPDLGRTISKAMEQLPAEQKKAIELAYFEA